MSTVAQVIDRLYREVLYPADDSPTQTTLGGAVTNVATAWTYDGTVLTADEEELLAPGVIIEVDQEQVMVTAADHNANTLTVRRAVNGTTAVAHDNGDQIMVAPLFARAAVFEAVCDNVVALFPQLYRTVTTAFTYGSTPVEAPAGLVIPVGGRVLSGGRYNNVEVTVLDGYGSVASGKAIVASATGAGYLTYRGKFVRPATEADELSTLGVDESWERIVMVGAAAQLLSLREFDSVNVEFVTEAMRGEGYPVGSASRQREALLRYYQVLLDQARRELLASNAEVVSVNSAVT